ncbi:MAG: Holliday junction branch migration protein RuvA [Clostridiales bacterium]|nr:Holliday junction branch migration protein RuvA [Clostridiales bacterium]
MYSYIIGKVVNKFKNILILENNNIGYEIYMTEIALSELNIDEEAKIYTYYNVSQDNISLFGFKNLEEKKMFENLISVSKIGAKTAIGILSSISTAEFAIAIITNDISRLSKLPGIGKKTAQRIVLEITDKVKTEEIIFTEDKEQKSNEQYVTVSEKEKDVVEALKVLGYNIKEIEQIMKSLDINSSTEDMIKQALKILR